MSLDPVRSALIRASAEHCGLDTTSWSAFTVEVVVGLDRPGFGIMDDASEGAFLCCHPPLFGLTFQYA